MNESEIFGWFFLVIGLFIIIMKTIIRGFMPMDIFSYIALALIAIGIIFIVIGKAIGNTGYAFIFQK